MKPYVKNRRTGVVQKAETRRLTEADLSEVLRVQKNSVGSLSDESVYVESDRSDFLNILSHGEMHGLFVGGELCGVASFLLPLDAELARDIGIEDDLLCRAFVLDSCFVAADYQNNGIDRELIRICQKRATEKYDALYLLATVSPKNIPSILAFMSINGFRVRALKQKYGCKLRYILCCEYHSKKLYTVYERLEITDVFGISMRLSEGYDGIATFTSEKKIYIWLAK